MTDTRDFDAFYTEARQRVLRCVFLLTGDLGEAQDSVQEAFVRAWQRWDAIAGYADPEAWVRLVACRIATSRWRRIRRGKTALHRYAAGMTQAILQRRRRHLYLAVSFLAAAVLAATTRLMIGNPGFTELATPTGMRQALAVMGRPDNPC